MVQRAAAHVEQATVAPMLAAARDPIFHTPSVLALLQQLFRPCMPRVAQVSCSNVHIVIAG